MRGSISPQRGEPLAAARVRTAWLFLAPLLCAAALVAGWPLLRTAMLAFTNAQLLAPDSPRWVGLLNFGWLLRDPDWWRAVLNTLIFTFCSVALQLMLGLAFALLLNALIRGRAVLRTTAILPWAIPTVVSAQMWAWMYHDVYGVINDLLVRIGVIAAPVAWLADPVSAMAAIVVTDVWKATPFVTLLLLAGLQTVPRSLHEAAVIDGAGPLRAFWAVTLPYLRPAIAVALVFRLVDALRVFDLIYVMTSNSRYTASMSIYVRQHLIDFQLLGYGSAAAIMTFVLIAAVIAVCVAWLLPAPVDE